jgi:sulfonate transport system substrate-binding protein
MRTFSFRKDLWVVIASVFLIQSFGVTTALAADLKPLLVGDQRGTTRAVLEASGQLKDVPYKIEWADFANAAPLLEALNADAIDVGGAGDAPLLFAQAAGAKIKAISATRYVSTRGVAIIANANSPLSGIASLRGKKVATARGSIGHYLLLSALLKAGLKTSDVNIIFLNPSEAKAALSSGAIDAWSIWDPYVAYAQYKDKAKIVVENDGLTSLLAYEAASDHAIAAKRVQLKDFVRRLAIAFTWASNNPEKYAKIQADISGFPLAVHLLSAKSTKFEPVPIDQKVIDAQQKTADVWFQSGSIPKRVNVKDGFDASFNPTF